MYAKLGNACQADANALTSNQKFIPPKDPVYYKFITDMYKFPGPIHSKQLKDPREVDITFNKKNNSLGLKIQDYASMKSCCN